MRLASETYSGIPLQLFCLFGACSSLFFLGFLNTLLYRILSSVISLLPIIIRTTEEALLSMCDSMSQARIMDLGQVSYGLFRIVLPVAMPGILAGV